MSIADPLTVLKMELTQDIVPQISDLLTAARADGRPLHEVERGLWDLVLQIGRQSLGAFLASHATGDVGETVTLPDGREVVRQHTPGATAASEIEHRIDNLPQLIGTRASCLAVALGKQVRDVRPLNIREITGITLPCVHARKIAESAGQREGDFLDGL